MGVAPPAKPRSSNCLKTVNSTKAMTTQMAALENILFTRTPYCGPAVAVWRVVNKFYSQYPTLASKDMGLNP